MFTLMFNQSDVNQTWFKKKAHLFFIVLTQIKHINVCHRWSELFILQIYGKWSFKVQTLTGALSGKRLVSICWLQITQCNICLLIKNIDASLNAFIGFLIKMFLTECLFYVLLIRIQLNYTAIYSIVITWLHYITKSWVSWMVTYLPADLIFCSHASCSVRLW